MSRDVSAGWREEYHQHVEIVAELSANACPNCVGKPNRPERRREPPHARNRKLEDRVGRREREVATGGRPTGRPENDTRCGVAHTGGGGR